MSRHKRHIDELFLMAQDVSPVSASRIASKITIGNKTVSFGVNSYKTDPLQKKYGKNDDAICVHAEILAIKNSFKRVEREDFKSATIYIARAKRDRENKKYIFGMAKPCVGCMRAIIGFGFSRVVYTKDDGEIEIL